MARLQPRLLKSAIKTTTKSLRAADVGKESGAASIPPGSAPPRPCGRMDAALPAHAPYRFSVYEPFLLNLILDDRKRIKKSRIDGGSALRDTPKSSNRPPSSLSASSAQAGSEQYGLAPRSTLTLSSQTSSSSLSLSLSRGLVSVGQG